MANRLITYGYKMENGILSIESHEAAVVNEIFNSYVNGTILNIIAKELTDRQEIYFRDKTVWNKNMIDRIICNRRYLGSNGYPAIIDIELFDKANTLKSNKGKHRVSVSDEISLIADRAICAECGKHYYRKPKWDTREKWICRGGCKTEIYISDKELMGSISDALIKAMKDSALIRVKESKETYIPTLDIIRRTNEIGQLSERSGVKFEIVSKAILEYANAKYLCCHEDAAQIYNDYVIQEIKSLDKAEVINAELITHIITNILIHKNGSITLCLINGAKINGRCK